MKKSHFKEQQEIYLDPEMNLPKTYFNLIEKVGSAGKYQRMMFFILFLIFFVNGSVMLSTSFIFMNNRYACQQFGLLTQECQESICEISSSEERKKYFVKNKEDIQSAATGYGPYMCEDEYQLDIIKGSPYFGSFLGYIIFSYISDNFGRRKTMIMSLGLGTLGTIIVAMGSNIIMISIGMIMSGAGINVSGGMLFCFLSEGVENLKRQKYSIIIQAGYNIAAIIMTGLYYFIGSWRINFILVSMIPTVIAFFSFVLYVQQTPQFLLKGQNKKALKSLNRIGYINFGLKDILSKQDLENVRAVQTPTQALKKQTINILDLFRYASVRKPMILGIFTACITTNMYYGPTLIINSIGFNTYATSMVIQVSQLIGLIPIYLYIEKLQRKKAGIFLLSIIAITALIMALLQKPDGCDFCLQGIIELILISIFRFAIAVQVMIYMVYSVELYPTKVVAQANGFHSILGMIMNSFCPLILGSLQRVNFNLMIYFFILAVFGCFVYFLLDQTAGKPMKAEIDQITFAKNHYLQIQHAKSQQNLSQKKKF